MLFGERLVKGVVESSEADDESMAEEGSVPSVLNEGVVKEGEETVKVECKGVEGTATSLGVALGTTCE